MLVPTALAVAFAMGVDPRRLTLLAGAVYLPFVLGVIIGLFWFRARPDSSNRPSLFCESVASELRAGATLRDALATAAVSVGSTAKPIGQTPLAELAAQVADEFSAIGQELELTVIAASRAGSDSAALFDEIGSLAMAQAEIHREVRVATAPGRATALLLVGAPVFYLTSQLGAGGLSGFLQSSEQRFVALLGLGLFLAGLAAACLVLWRASR